MKTKHCFQRLAAVLVCLMLCVSLIPQAAFASDAGGYRYKDLTDEQMSARYSLTLEFGSGQDRFPGVDFDVYKVAEMNRHAQFTELTEKFDGYYQIVTSEVNDPEFTGWAALANTLAAYVAADGVQPDQTITTNEQGQAVADELSVGLYLVIGERYIPGRTTYTPAPFLIAMPGWDAETESWGNVAANVKFDSYTEPITPPTDPTVQRRVLKVWDDESNEDVRPASVVIDLLRDGEVYDTVTLSAANNWRASWSNLSPNAQWQVVERIDSEDYQVLIEQEGITFVVTNTYEEPIDDPNTPGGDDPFPSESPNPSDEPAQPTQTVPPEDLGDDPVPGGPGDLPEDPTPSNPPLIPTNPPEEEEIDDGKPPLANLPQTGVLWWPVPVMGIPGVAFLLIGMLRRKSDCAE